MKTLLINILATSVLLSSCEKTIKNIELENKDPKLVLHGFISPDSAILANLTLSQTSLSADIFQFIQDGYVDIYEGDNLIHSLEHDIKGFYLSSENYLEPAKNYTVRATARDYPDATCSFTIPQEVNIISIDTTVQAHIQEFEWGENEEWKEFTFHVAFDDIPGEENFYIIRAMRDMVVYKYDDVNYEVIDSVVERGYVSISSEDISAEFGIHGNWIESRYEDNVYGSKGICFSDAFFSGKTKTFSFAMDYYPTYEEMDGAVEYYVYLENISKDYYTFLKSMALYEDTEYDPFAQNVNVFTNVEGGFGIIGAYSQTAGSITIGGK